jgi:hypothetical protein
MIFYRIKEDKQIDYQNKELKGFIDFSCQIFEKNFNKEEQFYYYWRLRNNSQDEMICTKIKFEDLYEVEV